MSLAIETVGLNFRPGKGFALQDLNLKVPSGSVYGFLGANGSGKTTSLRVLLGMLRADAGSIAILGEPMPANYPSVLARVGYVPERPHVYPALTATESMAFHASFHARWDEKWAGELAAQFGIPLNRPVASLSKGETGKLMMLLALAQRPELLVLDEPTDGLDPVARRQVRRALVSYVSSSGATVIISSHLVHELERICTWVGVMDHGRLLTQLPMDELRSGVKQLRLGATAASVTANTPFEILSRAPEESGTGEQWIVRGWEASMSSYLSGSGVELREVIDLDLEDAFVEILQNTRYAPAVPARN